ncbi:hypothetical protein AgCh_019073 [Apium graveolens]
MRGERIEGLLIVNWGERWISVEVTIGRGGNVNDGGSTDRRRRRGKIDGMERFMMKEVITRQVSFDFERKIQKGLYEIVSEAVAMDSKSIKVRVSVSSLGRSKPFVLDGFESSDTVWIVKERINALVFKTPIKPYCVPLHPAFREMVLSNGRLIRDDQTLVSLSESCGSNEITMHYLRYTTVFGTPDLHMLRLTHSEEKPDPFSILKRPKSICEIDSGAGLGMYASYVLFNSVNEIIPLSSFKSAVSIKLNTTPPVILLAPTSEIFNHLMDTKSEYLVLRVSWDMQSYFFLRTLRTSYPDIPIVAVTDLNPHHLDLLTFLDTPPEDVPIYYGWHVTRDSDEVDRTVIDFVNIQWLGLCPNDCDALHFNYDPNHAPIPGFDEVIRVLRLNPYFDRKVDWLAALDWLDLYHKPMSFLSGGDFISKKLSNKNWV